MKDAGAQDLLEVVAAGEGGTGAVGLEATLQDPHLTAPKAAEHAGSKTHRLQRDSSWKEEASSQVLKAAEASSIFIHSCSSPK